MENLTADQVRDIVRQELASIAGASLPAPAQAAVIHQYSVPEAAQYLRVSMSSVYKYVESGKLQGSKRGKWLYFTQTNLEQFKADHTKPYHKATGKGVTDAD